MTADQPLMILRALASSLLLLACSSETRNEPTPEEMCEDLVRFCEGLDDDKSKECHAVGEAGLKNARDQDQCFAFYPSCIDDCEFLSRQRPSPSSDASDGASETNGPRDAGLDASD